MSKPKYQAGREKEFLDILTEHLDMGVSILDSDLTYEYLSQQVFREMNIPDGKIGAGSPLSDIHAHMTEVGLLNPEINEKHKLSPEDQLARRQNGRERSTQLVRLANGKVHKFCRRSLPSGQTISISHDVTDLVEKSEMLDQAMELGHAGYWIYDIATKSYTLSKSLQHYFSGDDVEKIHAKGIITIVHPDDRIKFKQALANVAQTQDRFSVTCRTTSYKGNERWSRTNGMVERNIDGKIIQLRAFVHDVTRERIQSAALEKAKDEAVAANKAKSEFLANMSHEIRTPMNGVLGMAELLEQTEIDDRQRDYLKVINRSSQALLTIINDILDFSKIEAGIFSLNPAPFNLRDAMEDVVSLLAAKAQEKNIELIIDYPANLPLHFIGDAGRIRQVVTNLLGNAVKFTDEGHICLKCRIEPVQNGPSILTVTVKDTGIGIAHDKLDTVFEKFTQIDGTTTRAYGGTGLGLSISKRIVSLMQGDVWVDSELGQGSTFGFKMPLNVDSRERSKPIAAQALKGQRALIVDDIKVNRDILIDRLSSWNMRPKSVKDGMEALIALKEAEDSGDPYKLVLLDYFMPGMDGLNLAKLIKDNPAISDIPTIMLSSSDRTLSKETLETSGIHQYLVKPVREKYLLEAITSVISNQTIDVQIQAAPEAPAAMKAPRAVSVQPTDVTLAQIDAVLSQVSEHIKLDNFDNDVPVISAAQTATPSTPNNITAENSAVSILVAEDFPLNQDVVRLMLQDTIYNPVFANNGKEAVALYKAEPDQFAAILMDVSMPVMDGYEATDNIRSVQTLSELDHIPIIALTGHALKNDREKCLDAGMDDYLTKPVKQTDLINTLNRWILNTAQSAVA